MYIYLPFPSFLKDISRYQYFCPLSHITECKLKSLLIISIDLNLRRFWFGFFQSYACVQLRLLHHFGTEMIMLIPMFCLYVFGFDPVYFMSPVLCWIWIHSPLPYEYNAFNLKSFTLQFKYHKAELLILQVRLCLGPSRD